MPHAATRPIDGLGGLIGAVSQSPRHRTSVNGKVTDLVYEERDPAIFMQVKRTAADGFVALTLAGTETAEVRLVPAADETGAPVAVCTAGLKDDRVAYWEPAKLVAEVRRRSTSGNPAILHTDMDSGHQGSADLASEYGQKALFWAFAMRCV